MLNTKLMLRVGILCLALTTFIPSQLHAQPIPPFKMVLTSKRIFDINELPKGKPLILIYFDPDCDHCQRLMDTLFRKIGEFKKTEIVLASFKPIEELPAFEKKYGTSRYPNVKVGTENRAYYLRLYYDVSTLPFTALYDKKGAPAQMYRNGTSVDDLIKRLKAMK